jgi:DNA-binding transcriptional LysR family regulator
VALGFGIAIAPAFCIEPQDRGSLRARSVSHLFGQDRYGLLTKRSEPARTGASALIERLNCSAASPD